jgi:hypothetical protein
MRLDDLLGKLQDLSRQGHGDALVFDESGNDVTDAHAPLDGLGADVLADDERRGVMLTACVDYELHRKPESAR